jgi:hypothetical protein
LHSRTEILRNQVCDGEHKLRNKSHANVFRDVSGKKKMGEALVKGIIKSVFP